VLLGVILSGQPDISSKSSIRFGSAEMADDVEDEVRGGDDDGIITLVELLFFAYRDFTAESDAILGTDGLGRAHHRVLHFVRRQPDLRVSDLLTILKITKQSLARVLNELIEGGWIDSRIDGDDRRARRLSLTVKGEELARRLAKHQVGQILRALGDGVGGAREAEIRRFLLALIAAEEREHVQALIGEARGGTQ
jgi:DNA-binding MarR family transcriptional regulator